VYAPGGCILLQMGAISICQLQLLGGYTLIHANIRRLLAVASVAAGISVGLASAASSSAPNGADVVRSSHGIVAVAMVGDEGTQRPDYTQFEKNNTKVPVA
jgi:hypothetical protein